MMMTRRHAMILGLSTALLGSLGRFVAAQSLSGLPPNMKFDANGFKTLSTEVITKSGAVKVTYRFWQAIPYVTRPVDLAYQSLNISVPVEIDGKPVDASQAPVLFVIPVGGYMPASVANAAEIDGAKEPIGPIPGMPQAENAPLLATQSGSAMQVDRGQRVSNAKLGLAQGLVIVECGARGRTLVDAAGSYYGTAPAAIVDLKAAIRWLKANRDDVPGNMDQIITSGTSAGGALSALVGATGESPEYEPWLAEIGAVAGSDAVFAVGSWCPITDLANADAAYEWNWGENPLETGGKVDAALSSDLAQQFAAYQARLNLEGDDGYGPLTAETLGPYLVARYLKDEASTHLAALSDADRAEYLASHPAIQWKDGQAAFDWTDFKRHVGARKKTLPAFDAFDLSTGENNLFGAGKVQARHFTNWALRHASQDATAELDADLPKLVHLMTPMPYLATANPGRARNWWLRVGANDTDTSLSVVANLAAMAGSKGDLVNTRYYWDQGHGANIDADAFFAWISTITGYVPE